MLGERARSEAVRGAALPPGFIFQRPRTREKEGGEMTVKLWTVVEGLFGPVGPDRLP